VTRRFLTSIFTALALFTWHAPSPALAERCGPNDCGKGTTCCNYGCGICTPKGGACILPLCLWGRPRWIDAEHVPSVDAFDRAGASVAYTDLKAFNHGQGLRVGSMSGVSSRVRLVRRLANNLAMRSKLTASKVTGDSSPADVTFGYSLKFGFTKVLSPLFNKFLGWALLADAGWHDGPQLGHRLAGVALSDRQVFSYSLGLALGDLRQAVPTTAFVRVGQSQDKSVTDSFIDAGIAVSTRLGRYLYWFGGKPVPVGLRAHYRYSYQLSDEVLAGPHPVAHEFGGGLYYFAKKNHVRVGVDVEASFHRLLGANVHMMTYLVNVDWYWDANY